MNRLNKYHISITRDITYDNTKDNTIKIISLNTFGSLKRKSEKTKKIILQIFGTEYKRRQFSNCRINGLRSVRSLYKTGFLS